MPLHGSYCQRRLRGRPSGRLAARTPLYRSRVPNPHGTAFRPPQSILQKRKDKESYPLNQWGQDSGVYYAVAGAIKRAAF